MVPLKGIIRLKKKAQRANWTAIRVLGFIGEIDRMLVNSDPDKEKKAEEEGEEA